MKLRSSEIAVLIIILVSFGAGLYFYPQLPERMASHWNAQGQVDGYISKFWGAFLMPIISVLLLLLFVLIPRIDPLKQNIAKFRKYFDAFIILIIFFLLYLYSLTIAWNLGERFELIQFLVPAFAILFYYTGVLTAHAERNWFIGIRTPWTLSSETVWQKTHSLGGKLFKACGIIALLGLFFPKVAIWLVLVPVLAIAIGTIVYSYLEYQKENRQNF